MVFMHLAVCVHMCKVCASMHPQCAALCSVPSTVAACVPPWVATLSSPREQPCGRVPTDPFSPPTGCKLSCHTKCQSKVRLAPRGMPRFAWEGLWISGGVLGSISPLGGCSLWCLIGVAFMSPTCMSDEDSHVANMGLCTVGHCTQSAGSVRKGSLWLAAVCEPPSPFLCLLEAGEPPMRCF